MKTTSCHLDALPQSPDPAPSVTAFSQQHLLPPLTSAYQGPERSELCPTVKPFCSPTLRLGSVSVAFAMARAPHMSNRSSRVTLQRDAPRTLFVGRTFPDVPSHSIEPVHSAVLTSIANTLFSPLSAFLPHSAVPRASTWLCCHVPNTAQHSSVMPSPECLPGLRHGPVHLRGPAPVTPHHSAKGINSILIL